MGERDTLLTCESCGIRFVVTARERRLTAEAGSRRLRNACPGCTAIEKIVSRQRGAVKWYDVRKGYGFLLGEDGQDVFVHASGLRDAASARLRKGQAVEYLVEPSERGSVARDVIRIES